MTVFTTYRPWRGLNRGTRLFPPYSSSVYAVRSTHPNGRIDMDHTNLTIEQVRAIGDMFQGMLNARDFSAMEVRLLVKSANPHLSPMVLEIEEVDSSDHLRTRYVVRMRIKLTDDDS